MLAPHGVHRTSAGNYHVISGGRDNLGLPPVQYSAQEVQLRAEEAKRENFARVADDTNQSLSSQVVFCISQYEHSFTILNGDYLNHIPGRPTTNHNDSTTTRLIDPELLLGCYWSINCIPYMGFLPLNPYQACFGDPLFASIFQRKWDVPLEKNLIDQWQLLPSDAQKWNHLETILISLRDILKTTLPFLGSHQHLPAPAPSYYRFAQPHADRIILSKRIMRARYAFLLLGAEISFLFALQVRDEQFLPVFMESLHVKFRHELLVKEIFSSWPFLPGTGFYHDSRGHVDDSPSSVARQGMFVNVETCTFDRALIAYESFTIPVWFWWGNRVRTLNAQSPFVVRRYGFTRAMVQRYLFDLGGTWDELKSGLLFLKMTYKRPFEQRPTSRPVQLFNDQSHFAPWEGEDWYEFSQRRERAILARKVSDQEAVFIIERQQRAKQIGLNRISGVFCWEPSVDSSKKLVRRKIPSTEAALVWGQYPPSQREYCATYDEWDLCAELNMTFHPNLTITWREEESISCDSESSDDLPLPASAGETWNSNVFPLPQTSHEFSPSGADTVVEGPKVVEFAGPETDETEDGEIIENKDDTPSAPVNWNTIFNGLFPIDLRSLKNVRQVDTLGFEDTITAMYGVYVPETHLIKPQEFLPENSLPNEMPVEVKNTPRFRCMQMLSAGSVRHHSEKVINGETIGEISRYFQKVAWFSKADDISTLPAGITVVERETWWDAALQCSDPQSIAYRLNNLHMSMVVKPVHWTSREDTAYQLYVLKSPVRILLYRAADVFIFLRHFKGNLENVILMMVSRGIRFSIATPKSNTHRLEQSATKSIAPMYYTAKPHGFKPNVLDYAKYVVRRNKLLSSAKVLRAALMTGGIVWRLAMEHYPDVSVVLAITKPELEAGTRSHLSNGEVLCEEALTEDQIDVICGAYSVVGSADVSWFPKSRTWPRSGIAVGFWSADAEKWYQNRVYGYLCGEKIPETHARWRQSLKLHKMASKVARGYEEVCRKQLNEYLGSDI